MEKIACPRDGCGERDTCPRLLITEEAPRCRRRRDLAHAGDCVGVAREPFGDVRALFMRLFWRNSLVAELAAGPS